MCNRNAKQGFMLEQNRNKFEIDGFETILNLYKPIEDELGKDLCCFSIVEHCRVLDPLFENGGTERSWTGFYMIRLYLRWCVANRVAGAIDSLDGYAPGDLSEFGHGYVSGPEELRDRMDEIFTAEERMEPDILIRAFLWLLFMGIPIPDAVELKTSDVDLSKLEIVVREKTFPIHPLALSTIVRVYNCTEFLLVHSLYTAMVPRFESDSLLRSRRSDSNPSTLRVKLFRALHAKGIDEGWLSPRDVYQSGYFYRALQGERQGKPADFTSYVLAKGKRPEPRWLREACMDTTSKYCRWKLANNIF